mgnify:CR=1 FL=1
MGAIVKELSPLLALFFFILSLGFGGLSVYRGEVISNLRGELLKDKDKELKVIVETVDNSNAVATAYELGKSERQVDIKVVKEKANEIIKENTVFLNTCISDDGLYEYNQYLSTAYASQPSGELPKDTTTK